MRGEEREMPLTPLSIAQAILPHIGVSANFNRSIHLIEGRG